MYTISLEETICDKLKTADEAWFAAGLLTESGLKYLDGLKATVHLMVGIDLPTPPNVLRKLMVWTKQGHLRFKIFAIKGIFFHPKVYIIRHGDNYCAYVGSGNLTQGGWKNNIELFWEIDKRAECESLINWFNVNMKLALQPSENFIAEYEQKIFSFVQQLNQNQQDKLDKFKGSHENDYDYFFRKEDFQAFTSERAINKEAVAKDARKLVNRKFISLHQRIFKRINEMGWDLNHHSRPANIVSNYAHTARNSKVLDGMWLYYGKSTTEAAAHPAKSDEERSMNNHVRLQIIIQVDNLGIWCAVGKSNGSKADRLALQEKLEDPANQRELYYIIKNLGDEYFIALADRDPSYNISEIKDEIQLANIIKRDKSHMDCYFIIGMNLSPDDPRLLDRNIDQSIIDEFSKLYPLYQFIKAPIPGAKNQPSTLY